MQSLAIRHDLTTAVLAASPTRYLAPGRYVHILYVPAGASFNLRFNSLSDTARPISAPTSFHLDDGSRFESIYIDNAAFAGEVVIEVSDDLCLSTNGGGIVAVTGTVALTVGASVTLAAGAEVLTKPARVAIASLTIPAADTDSGAVAAADLDKCGALSIYAPAVLDAGVYTIQVRAAAGGPWCTLQSNAADVEIAAGKAITLLRNGGFQGLRIHCTIVAAADRVFQVAGSAGA